MNKNKRKPYTIYYWNPPASWERNPTYGDRGACFGNISIDDPAGFDIFYKTKCYTRRAWALRAYRRYFQQGREALKMFNSDDEKEQWQDGTYFVNGKGEGSI